MKPLCFVALVSAFGPLAMASDVLVYDTGTKNGGDGPRHYSYVVVSSGEPIMQFAVGMGSLDYNNVIKPPGWWFETGYSLTQNFGVNTSAGIISEGGPGTAGILCGRWYTTSPDKAVQSFEFGFDHAWSPGDVGWYARGRTNDQPITAWIARENWNQPVGMSLGPVHGPTHLHPLCSPASPCMELFTFCRRPFGACEGVWGECVFPPEICPHHVAPVCGCDGVTYTNSCMAGGARVSIAHAGACGEPYRPPYDYDADGLMDGYDNCMRAANPDQADSDADFVGDACDACPNTILAVGVDSAGCPPVAKGDCDRDGDVDAADFDAFTSCLTGPALGPPSADCTGQDFDWDHDVDQSDFAVFQRCLTGENAPANPTCY
jgi:hypothetical protein